MVNLTDWNLAAIMKNLWAIAHKKDSLWVKWIHTYYVKRRQVWDMPVPNKCSWNLKKLLKCRELVDKFGGWAAFEKNGRYSIGAAYRALQIEQPKVQWSRIITNSKASPSSLFITWLAVQNRLATKERLCHWITGVDNVCLLCQQAPETCSHLFFECAYSFQIWENILNLLKFARSPKNLSDETQIMCKVARRKTSCCRLLTIAFAESIYVFWKARNRKLFENELPSCNSITREIIFRIACRVDDETKMYLLENQD